MSDFDKVMAAKRSGYDEGYRAGIEAAARWIVRRLDLPYPESRATEMMNDVLGEPMCGCGHRWSQHDVGDCCTECKRVCPRAPAAPKAPERGACPECDGTKMVATDWAMCKACEPNREAGRCARCGGTGNLNVHDRPGLIGFAACPACGGTGGNHD